MSRSNRCPHRARPRHVLRLELLEGRDVPSTCVVNSLGDAGVGIASDRGDLRFCLSQANARSGEDLFIFSVQGTINLTKALPDITDDLIIAGPGAGQLTVNAQQKGRVLTIDAGVTAHVYSVTLTNGLSLSGGGVRNDGTLTLGSVVVSGNTNLNGDGGGVYNTGDLTVIDSTLANNTISNKVTIAGGGLYNAGGSVAITGSSVSGNSGSVTAQNGWAYSKGAGVYSTGSLTMDDSSVTGNKLYCSASGEPGCHQDGAGVANLGVMTVSASLIYGNIAGNAAAGSNGSGGGVYNAGTLTLADSAVSTNSARSLGGGLYNAPSANLAVSQSTVTGNSAHGSPGPVCSNSGGGISNDGAMSLSGATVSGNHVQGDCSSANDGYGGGVRAFGRNDFMW
jgi:hypothetical protein